MRKLIVLVFVLSISNLLSAQNLEYGKVSKQELLEKKHPKDTSAVAAILSKQALTKFFYTERDGFQCETNYEIRLKIYKKEGFAWANYSIPYYIGWTNLEKDNVFFSDVVTYNLENDKIEKTKLTSDGSFKEKINDYWMKKTITFPNIKEGSVIEFKYKLVSENLAKLPDFDFQEKIPVNFAEYRTEIPVNYEYKTILRGYSKVEQESKSEVFTQNVNAAFNQTRYITFTLNKQKYTLKDIPALKEEPYIDNLENHRIKIENELSAVSFSELPTKKYSETWLDVAVNITQDNRFKNEIQKKGYFENNLKAYLNDTLSQTSKTKIIFNYVKTRIKWDGSYGYFPKSGVVNAYNNRTGNVADINMNLIIMLKSAGINAYPVLLSTRSNGKHVFPSRDGFNYLIAKATIDGRDFLMDATDENATLNILPIRCLNGFGRSISSAGYTEEVNLDPATLSKSITYVQADLQANGKLTGKIRNTKSDYFAYLFRDRYLNIDRTSYLEKLESELSSSDINEYTIENVEDFDKTIIETFSFSNDGVCDLTGNKIIFSPFGFLTKLDNPFKAETRIMPIDFIFPLEYKHFITITIPDGYEVESSPKATSVSLLNTEVSLNFNCSSDTNKITISTSFSIQKSAFDAIYYDDIKNIFKKYSEKQSEFIILKKK